MIVLKSEHEIAIMREAGLILRQALDAVRDLIEPGVTTLELDEAAERVLRSMGATPTFLGVTQYEGQEPFPATITASINDELVHGIPSDRTLKQGDIISIDCGATYRGYVADSAFTAAVGEISTKAQQLLDVTQKSLDVGIEMMRAGNRTGDVSAAIQKVIESNGFSIVREYTGHGVGRSMWEPPQVPNFGIAGRGTVLRPGMTIALEPMVNMGQPETKIEADQWTVSTRDGKLCAHFEHSIAVTENGPLVLTQL